MRSILIKSAFRSLQKRKWYSILSIFGLSVGFSAFIVIGLFIKYELTWDSYNKNYDRIYRIQTYKTVNDEYVMQSAPAIIDHIKNKYNDIENQGLVFSNQIKYLAASKDQEAIEVEGQYADQGYLDIFTINFIKGSQENALSEPMSIILSESTSAKLYGTTNPVGAILWLEKKYPLKVTGVYTDLPKNSHLQPEFMIAVESLKGLWNKPHVLEDWDYTVFYTYIQTREDADIAQLDAELKDLLKDKVLTDYRQLYLLPLSKLYVASTNNNYLIVIYLLGILAILVLLLASINFMNMIIATSTLRAKEIGIKKVVGSNRGHLMLQIYLESFVITAGALFLSLIFVELSLNAFNQVTDKDISIGLLFTNHFYLLIIAILAIVSIISSIYPSWIITSISSIDLFKNNFNSRRRNRVNLKKFLVGFQFAVSIGLISISVLMTKQVWYMHTKDLGFKNDDLAFVELSTTNRKVSIDKMKGQLEIIPGIKSISFSGGFPMHSSRYTSSEMMNWEGGAREERLEVRTFWVNYDFVNTMGMEMIAGRNFSREFPADVRESCIINETAAIAFGWDNPVGKYINDKKLKVVGVFKDIHFHDIYNQIRPIVLTMRDDASMFDGTSYFGFRIAPERFNEMQPKIRATMSEFFPNDPFEVVLFNNHFEKDQHFAIFNTIIHIFIFLAIIAILLSVFGVIGLVNHSLNQRTKEIAIRKVSGCSSLSIFQSLTSEYLMIILIASAFGSLAARFVFNNMPLYYPMPQKISDYLIGVMLALGITLVSIVYKTLKESTRNPVESLRYE